MKLFISKNEFLINTSNVTQIARIYIGRYAQYYKQKLNVKIHTENTEITEITNGGYVDDNLLRLLCLQRFYFDKRFYESDLSNNAFGKINQSSTSLFVL